MVVSKVVDQYFPSTLDIFYVSAILWDSTLTLMLHWIFSLLISTILYHKKYPSMYEMTCHLILTKLQHTHQRNLMYCVDQKQMSIKFPNLCRWVFFLKYNVSKEALLPIVYLCEETISSYYRRFIAGPTLNNSKKNSWIFLEIIT